MIHLVINELIINKQDLTKLTQIKFVNNKSTKR